MELLAPDEVDEVGVRARVVSDADVLILPSPSSRSVFRCVDIDEVVHLHELDALVFEQSHRTLHPLDTFCSPCPPEPGVQTS